MDIVVRSKSVVGQRSSRQTLMVWSMSLSVTVMLFSTTEKLVAVRRRRRRRGGERVREGG